MKKSMTVLAVLISVLTYAEVSMVWEIDLNTYGVSNVFGTLRLPNESVIVAQKEGDLVTLLAFDAGGTNQLVDIFPVSWMELGLIASDPNHFAASIWDSSTGTVIKIYELQGTSYVNTANISQSGGNPISTSGSINSDVFYVVEGTMLKQYSMGTAINPGGGALVMGSMASGIDGSNYIMQWDSVLGVEYQIQSSMNLTNWVDVGLPFAGNGAPLAWANSLTNSKSFYRVIEN